jgi:hypothetical protein
MTNNSKNSHTGRPPPYNEIDMMTHKVEGGYLHYEIYRNIAVTITKTRQNGQGFIGELSIEAPELELKRNAIVLHLQDFKARHALALELAQATGVWTDSSPIPWDKIIDWSINETIKLSRKVAQALDASAEPEILYFPSAIQGIEVPTGLPTTIFSPGGKGKSIFAAFIATLRQYGILAQNGLDLIPGQGNVLYLDWESDIEVIRVYFKAIRAGLGITDSMPISYIPCDRSIFNMADSLREFVKEHEIDFVIIDSQMAASAGGPQYQSEADKASEYYNILNSLKCTTLTIDHVNKESMKSDIGGTGTAYGTVVKYNRARSQYELRSQQDSESDHLEFSLVHQKYNLGRKQKPLGIAVDFENVGGELRSIKFSKCNLANNPELEKTLPSKERIKNLLLSNGLMTIQQISENTGIPEASIRTIVNREKNMFVKNGNTWGVLNRNETP